MVLLFCMNLRLEIVPNSETPKKPESSEGREWTDDEIIEMIEDYYHEINEMLSVERSERVSLKDGLIKAKEEFFSKSKEERLMSLIEREVETLTDIKTEVEKSLDTVPIERVWEGAYSEVFRFCEKVYHLRVKVDYLKDNLKRAGSELREEYRLLLESGEAIIRQVEAMIEKISVSNLHESVLKTFLQSGRGYGGIVQDENFIADQALVVEENGEIKRTLDQVGTFFQIGINEYGSFNEKGELSAVARLVTEGGLQTGGDNENGLFARRVLDIAEEMQRMDRSPVEKLEHLVNFVTIHFTSNIEVGEGLFPGSVWLDEINKQEYFALLADYMDTRSAEAIASYFDTDVEETGPWDEPALALSALRAVQTINKEGWDKIAEAIRGKVIHKDSARVVVREVADTGAITWFDYDAIAYLADEVGLMTDSLTLQETEDCKRALRALSPEDQIRVKALFERTHGLACKFFTNDTEPLSALSHLEAYEDELTDIIDRYVDMQKRLTLFVRDLVDDYTELQVNYDQVLRLISQRLDAVRSKISRGEMEVGSMDNEFEDALLLGSVFKTAFQENPDLRFEDIRGLELESVDGRSISAEDSIEMLRIFDLNWVKAPKEVASTFREKLDRALSSQDQFNLLRKEGEIIGFMRFQDVGEGKVNATSFNIRPDYRGSKLGETFLRETVDLKAREATVVADSRIENPALEMYINRMSLVGVDIFGILGDNGDMDLQLVLERRPDIKDYINSLDENDFKKKTLDISIEQDLHFLEDLLQSHMITYWEKDGSLVSLIMAPKPEPTLLASK